MNKIENWDGKIEKTTITYECNECEIDRDVNTSVGINTKIDVYKDEPDKMDCIVAASCGVLTGILDSIWVGKFSLDKAQTWGRLNANDFVIRVAKFRGYDKDNLNGAIRFLENDAPIPSDQLTPIWGGGLQHHFRDFAHHASIVGLAFSVISQFTGLSYGTNTDGLFVVHDIPDKGLIGATIEEKLYNGIVIWALHLVSDMSGSSGRPGKGTGIPGPILSLAKELSVLPGIRNMHIEYKGSSIGLSVMLAKIFNGTAFEHKSNDDLLRFDLRTEMGVYAFGIRQSVPVIINQCMVRAFYFVKRLLIEINSKQISGIRDISTIELKHVLPVNNKCINRMLTISSGVFCVVDASDAAIRAFLKRPQDKKEFFTKFMLRTNFSGIGYFVISLKNDIYARHIGGIGDSNCNSNVIFEDNEFEPDGVTIDISAEIDNNSLYQYAFYKMRKYVEETKEKISVAQKADLGIERKIFCLEDDETTLYNMVANLGYRYLVIETGELLMRLLSLNGVEYTQLPKEALCGCFMPFYMVENGRKIGYLLSNSITPNRNFERIKAEYNIDGIKVIALVEMGDEREIIENILEETKRKSNGFIQCVTIKDFLGIISENEYEVYLSYVQNYNAEIKKLIGYRTVVMPSETAVDEFKNAFETRVQSSSFAKWLAQDGITNDQIIRIENNLFGRALYKAILGNGSFAESFISSEWYYKEHVDFSVLEHTAIVAGYIKSVEQLLYTIVLFSKGPGRTIKRIGQEQPRYIDFTDDNDGQIDKTLGALIGYVNYYSDLWDTNKHVKGYVIDRLNEYRQKYRNDYFHKDNISDINEIEEIREKTIFLIFLLLGTLRIQDTEKAKLGIIERIDDGKHDITYEMLEEWLDRIMGGDVLLPKSAKLFFEVSGYGENWRLSFSTISGVSDHGLPENIDWPYIGDELMWDRVLNRDANVEKVTDLLCEYLEKSKFSGIIKSYSSIYVGRFSKIKKIY